MWKLYLGLPIECVVQISFYFSTQTYVLVTQKNHLDEMVLLSIHNIKQRDKKIVTFLPSKSLIIETFGTFHILDKSFEIVCIYAALYLRV